MEIQELNYFAKKVIEVKRTMDYAFGESDDHIRIAIMAGIGDAYWKGYTRGHVEGLSSHNLSQDMLFDFVTPQITETLTGFIKAGEMLQAIKFLREKGKESNGVAPMLKDCKDYVDNLRSKQNAKNL